MFQLSTSKEESEMNATTVAVDLAKNGSRFWLPMATGAWSNAADLHARSSSGGLRTAKSVWW